MLSISKIPVPCSEGLEANQVPGGPASTSQSQCLPQSRRRQWQIKRERSKKDLRNRPNIFWASHQEVQALSDLIPLAEQAGAADKLGGGLFNLAPRHA